MKLTQLIGKNCIAVIGGGGKTSFLERLEGELHAAGRPALVSTTTRLAREQFGHLRRLTARNPAQMLAAAEKALAGERILLTAPDMPGDREAGRHLRGLSPALFAALAHVPRLHILIEADGSRGLPLKVHREGEPPLPALPCFLVAVLGLTALALPAAEAVHRPELLSAHIGPVEWEMPLMPAQIAAFVKSAWRSLHPDLVFLNQLDAVEGEKAEALAALLREAGFQCVLESLRAEH